MNQDVLAIVAVIVYTVMSLLCFTSLVYVCRSCIENNEWIRQRRIHRLLSRIGSENLDNTNTIQQPDMTIPLSDRNGQNNTQIEGNDPEEPIAVVVDQVPRIPSLLRVSDIILRFKKWKVCDRARARKDICDDVCSICLSEFANSDTVKELPCGHIYHVQVWR
ncbi:hypothetical protein HK098_002759 [Nowakowskiella sp. JEL0407]|nr:hypothetical protein HK098_002759 [Nowakowskiella sp. JEL0407]